MFVQFLFVTADEDGLGRKGSLEASEHFDPVAIAKHNVGNHQVERPILSELLCFGGSTGQCCDIAH